MANMLVIGTNGIYIPFLNNCEAGYVYASSAMLAKPVRRLKTGGGPPGIYLGVNGAGKSRHAMLKRDEERRIRFSVHKRGREVCRFFQGVRQSL